MRVQRCVLKESYGDDVPNINGWFKKIFRYNQRTVLASNGFASGSSFIDYTIFWSEHECEPDGVFESP